MKLVRPLISLIACGLFIVAATQLFGIKEANPFLPESGVDEHVARMAQAGAFSALAAAALCVSPFVGWLSEQRGKVSG